MTETPWIESFARVNFLDRPSRAVTYGFIAAFLILATIVRYELSFFLGEYSPFITYIPVIVIGAWIAGFEGGVIVTVASTLIAAHYFMPPAHTQLIRHESASRIELYAFEGLLISLLGHAQYQSRRRELANARTAARNAELADQRAVELAKSEERRRLAIDGAHVGTWHMDINTRLVTLSETMWALLGKPGSSPEVLVDSIDALHPEDQPQVSTAIQSCIESHTDFNIEYRVVWPDGSVHWQVGRGCCYYDQRGNALSLEAVGIDISARKKAEEDANARARSANALSLISRATLESRDPVAVQEIALRELADVLKVDRAFIVLIQHERDAAEFVAEWHRDDLTDLRGEHKISDFDVDLDDIFADGSPLVVADIDSDNKLSRSAVARLKSIQVAAHITVPMYTDGNVVGFICVAMADAVRPWAPEEIAFVGSVAAHLRSATESTRVIAEVRSRAAREALINRIGEVMRTSLDQETIQTKAVALLGEALGADRCYFALYNLVDGIVTISRDWHRPDLPSIQGVHAFVNTEEMFNELYCAKSTSIIRDRDRASLSPQTIDNMKGLQLRSRLSAAVADSAGMATLTAAMSDGPRDWLPDEVALVERVAALLKSGVEMARVQQREHRIATDLQNALLPVTPKSIPGLRLGGCMVPALDEAELGGDFFDVFALDGDRYALVIGDVSGKGLAAAAQLATVRNSLRAYLYLTPTPSQSLTTLNRVMTAHELLNGFVTLFVGVYEPSTATLAYASCGHEPVLLKRSTDNSILRLATPGPPIGVDHKATYTQESVVVEPGDLVLFYTDGLSEAGPSRKEMIEIEGIERLLHKMTDFSDIDKAAAALVDEARKHANGLFRDDVCILLATAVPERD